MKLLLAMLLFTNTALAMPRVIFLNKCPDYTDSWDCLNATQGSQHSETLRQVKIACRGIKCPTIYSVDPIQRGIYDPKIDMLYQSINLSYEFGAWRRRGRVEFAAMPGCVNTIAILRKLVRAR
jgi:hypothetical protein